MTLANPILSSRDIFVARSAWRWQEGAYWLCAAASFFLFPDYLVLLTQILITGLFALSFDLMLGYGGIPSLGHAAFFGLGAYAAGLVSAAGWGEPLTGLVVAALVAAAFGFLCSLVVARLHGLALLMVTMGIGLILYEVAQRARDLTGGDDGLQGISTWPLLGLFPFDFYGRVAFLYVFAVVLLVYLAVRRLVHSPFGLALEGMRENIRRVPALGISVRRRYMVVFTISAGIAGIAGGLLAETQSVSIEVLSFERSTAVLIMLLVGGMGSLIGALIGAAVFMLAQNELSILNPVYWNFWIGLLLVLLVLFWRGGIMGALDRATDTVAAWWRGRS
jgi:branched-chain amino acid transport system permease protein